MTYASYDAMLCHECGWREDNPEKAYRKCPECGAAEWGIWKEKTFHRKPEDRVTE